MNCSREKITYFSKEGLTLLFAFDVEQNTFFFALNLSKQKNVPPFPSLSKKSRQHVFGGDAADLATFQNREGQVESKACWCWVSIKGGYCQWLLTELPHHG